MNAFVAPNEELGIELLTIDPEIERRQVQSVQKLRRERDNNQVQDALDRLRVAARGNENMIPCILECVRAYTTQGEIVQALREIFGEYKEKPTF